MSLTEILAVIVSTLSGLGALVFAYWKNRRTDSGEQIEQDGKRAEMETEQTETVIDQMNRFNRDREKRHAEDLSRLERRHNDDITRLERALSERDQQLQRVIVESAANFSAVNQKERDCQIAQAELRVELAHEKARGAERQEEIKALRDELKNLKSELRARGEIGGDSGIGLPKINPQPT